MLGRARYRFAGFDLWRANIARWNQPPNTSYDLNDGDQLERALKDLRARGPHLNVIRVWFFQQFAVRDGRYDWSAFDKTLRIARANGFRVIATLADQWPYEGTRFKDERWYRSGYAESVARPFEVVTYRRYVQDVVRRYRDNGIVLAWELVNEPDVAASGARPNTCDSRAETVLFRFVTDIGRLVKSVDPDHLLSLGTSGDNVCGTVGREFEQVMAAPSLDVCSFHDFAGAQGVGVVDESNGLGLRAQECSLLRKPIYVGEVGIHTNGPPCYGNLQCRADYLREKASAAFSLSGVVGYVVWQYDNRGSQLAGGDDYVYGPSDPGIVMLSRLATR